MERHLINGSASIVEALEALNRLSGASMVLFVTGEDGRLIGSLTDGDVRRALLGGRRLEDSIADICKRDCLVVYRDRHDTGVITKARDMGITLLPMVEYGVVVGLIDLRRQRGLVPADAVLMAGGMGERLRPLTAHCPKPLLPVGGKPIIDHNIELLRQFGIENIYVSVNYLKEQVIEHISRLDASITCVEEPTRLGTIGALALVKGIQAPNVIVMNADLLTDINLEAMYIKHLETEAWLTMAVTPYTVSVPFAIVDHEGERVKGLTEKPTYNYYANAGIYMMRREVVEGMRKGEYLDATDLIERVLATGRRVSLFQISGRWIDIGSPDDYRHACEIMTPAGGTKIS